MHIKDRKIYLDDDDLKEIFSLFCSPTRYEISQVYSEESGHFYLDVRLKDEFSLTEEKKEFAIDAWRSVLLFLKNKGFELIRDQERSDLKFLEAEIA